MQPVRLLLIGAGTIGRTHIDRIGRDPLLALAGIVDPTDTGRQLAEHLGVPWAVNHVQLLEQQRPDGAIVATPNASHVSVAQDCLTRGVAALVEKPIADTVDEALVLCHAEADTGVPVLMGHHRRHNPINRRARDIIESGRLGRLVNANVMSSFYKPEAYFDIAWRRQPGGGPVLINLIHEIDMLRFLCGDIIEVQALCSNAVRGFAVEDTAAVLLRFDNGMLATMVLSDTATSPWCWDFCAGEQDPYPRQAVQSHFITGTHGSLSLPDLALWHYQGDRNWHAEITKEMTAVHKADPYTVQLQHFAAIIRGEQTPLCSARDGLHTLQATLAVLEAAAKGRSVTCPLSTP